MAPRASASILPGTLIVGRYAVDHALGKGGMGSVYAVRELSSGRELALKYLQRQAALENGPAAALFQREYHTLAHLSHPCVIKVYDYGVDRGRPYYTMERLDGSDLREIAPLGWKRACRLLRDVASSLALLHSRRLLHRDLSPRNVRCTHDGRAKLIDFGAMAPMGAAKDVAGTAPYMAPEAVHGQALDARTDLYALGALSYWTLTGHDAYCARDSYDLRQLWPRPISPPSSIASDVPEALDSLVMSLLSLDPQARPNHAAEVIERLTAIAGLEPLDPVEVAHAYLISPTLVGHADTTASFHKRLVRTWRGRGSALLVRGAAGLGRSRVLSALVLEAKLSGIQVLTAGAEDARRGELGVMRTLVDALVESAPDVALPALRLHASALSAWFPQLYPQSEAVPAPALDLDPGERLAQAMQAIRDLLVTASQHRPLMIAVDDVDRADEWSLVCLTLLAGDARVEHLALAAAIGTQPAGQALEVLSGEAACMELVPLDAAQTASLLRSVFGDVPHLRAVSDWTYALSQGNPRSIMVLAQYLVDRGIARYERGTWTLPDTLRDQALPESIEQAIEELLRALSPRARAFAETLALLTAQGQLSLEELLCLRGFEDVDQTYRALDELVAAQIAVAAGTSYVLRQHALVQTLQRQLPEDRRRQLHLSLAELYEARARQRGQSSEPALLAAHHRHLGGDMQGCLAALSSVPLAGDCAFGRTPEASAMYEACLAYAERAGLPPAQLHPLRKALLRLSSTADPSLIKHVDATLAQLCHDSGLIYFDDFRAELDPRSRIRLCVQRARKEHERSAPEKRGLEPVEAIYELAACALSLTETYVVRNDAAALGRLIGLIEPFRPHAAVFELLHELAEQAQDSLLGKDVAARLTRLLGRLELPLTGLDGISQHAMRCVLTYWLGIDEAVVGKASALERAATLERGALYAPLGAQVRSIYHLFKGAQAEAETWQRRRELLALQTPFTAIASARGVLYEALGYYLCGNVLGMRRVLQTVAKLAARYPGLEPERNRLEGLYALLRGEPSSALLLLANADAAGRVQALLSLGQADAARDLADEALAEGRSLGSRPLHLLRLHAARALAWSESGQAEAAAEALDAEIRTAEANGISGLLLCAMHEARARIAIGMDDSGEFGKHIRVLAGIYSNGPPGLRARYQQLRASARSALITVPPTPPFSSAASHGAPAAELSLQLSAGLSREQRCEHALFLLARRAKSVGGFLFALQRSGHLRLAASVGAAGPPDGLQDMLGFYLNAELATGSPITPSAGEMFAEAADRVAWINDGQHLYYPVLLYCMQDQRRLIGGVAALAFELQREPELPVELVSEISSALFHAGDLVGVLGAN